MGPIDWRIPGPVAGRTSEAKSGGGSLQGEDPARGEAAHDRGAADDHVDEADEVVAHVVEGVATRRPRAAALAPEVHGEDLEVLGQPRNRRLVPPPRLGL